MSLVIRANTRGPSRWMRTILPWRLKPGSTVVDLGCGAGRNSRLAMSLGAKVTPVDRYPDYGYACELRHGIPLPFPSGYADMVLLNHVLMFLDEDTRHWVAGECRRILRAEGHLVAETHQVVQSLAPHRWGAEAILRQFVHSVLEEGTWETYVREQRRSVLVKKS